ncbi:MAG: START domain-containing protein [Alcanivoracaceae bacterium]|nr:START domain-containing protein [Alcanivoracaceae bacterium]
MKTRYGMIILVLVPLLVRAEPAWHSAEVTIPASMERVVKALEKPCEVLQWMPDLDTIRVLEKDGAGRSLVYMRSHAPWPFAPRDAVLAFRRENTPGQVLITMRAEPTAMPEQPGYVRIPASDAEWSLRQRNGTTLVNYRSRVAPGGQVPQWLSDRFARRAVARAVTALREHVIDKDSGKKTADCAAADQRRDSSRRQ